MLRNREIKVMDKLKSKRGTETIEFVILVPLMLFLVFGFMSFVLVLYAKVVVADAAREGARAEALGVTTALEKVKDVLKGYNLNDKLIDDVKVDTKEENGFEYITVNVIYKQPSLFPGLPRLIGSSEWPSFFKVTSAAVFKKEKL